MMDVHLKDTVVVVTGGTSTLGEAICRVFLEEGAHVWCCWTSAQGKERAAVLEKEAGSRLFPLGIDVRDASSVTKACETVVARHGGLDVLINNAGVFTVSLQAQLDEADWNKVFDTNITGIWRMVKAFAPYIHQGGSIVNVSSMNASHPGFGGTAHYDASKGAVSAYTASLAVELAPHVRVNAVAPGLLDAPYLHEGDASLARAYEARAPLGKLVQAEDVAATVVFLASARACAITGQVISVDCGYPLR